MPVTDPQAFDGLLSRLAQDRPDDVAVVSVVARRCGDGRWSLLSGSVLLGPADLAACSWLDWRAASGDAAAAQVSALLSQQGVTLSAFADFVSVDGDWLIARRRLAGDGSATDQVRQWVTALMGPGAAVGNADDTCDLVTAALEPADALAMSTPWRPSDLQPLVFGARRPVIGYRFPLAGLEDPAPEPPASWATETTTVSQPLLNLLGLGAASSGALLVPALAIGRLRRTAWFSDVRLTEYIEATVTLDPLQANPGDLEVDLEEYARDGLVHARRLHLADVAIPGGQHEHLRVVLPTLGPELRRQLRLYDRAGRLLDTCEADAFVSQLKLTMTAQAGPETVTHEILLGQQPAMPSPVTRLAALDAAEGAYTRLLTEGTDRRILDDPNTALAALQDSVQDALDELLILDPYFGRKAADWQVLAKVTVPVRVLTMHKGFAKAASGGKPARPAALIPVPDQASIQHLPRLGIRSWSQVAPWHDRVYLWTGGGLTVGGSPGGLGKRLMRMDRLTPVEAQAWRTRFDTWWQDQLAIQVR